MSEEEQPATHQVGLLQKGLSVVEKLIAAQQPLSLTGIAEVTGIDTSSAHRILKILAAENYVLRDSKTKRYVPGPKAMYPLGLYHPLNVARRDALPVLRSLCDETGQTIGMVAFIYGERIALEVILGRERLTPFYETHVRRPLHSSASGKLLLMNLNREQQTRILGQAPYPQFTPHTITRHDDLEREFTEARQLGFTRAIDEAFTGLSAVAAPIKSASATVLGCFVIFGTSQTLTPERIPQFGERLKQAAELFTYMSPSLEALEIIVGPAADGKRNGR